MTRSPRLFGLALSLAALGSACKDGALEHEKKAEVRLTRGASGRIAVEVIKGTTAIRAAQVELKVQGSSALVLEDPQPPPGIPLDTVRIQMRGANRAILFTGDERGALLPRSGVIATFVASAPAGPDAPGVEVAISKALLVDADGARIDAVLGPALIVR